jgi:transketolase
MEGTKITEYSTSINPINRLELKAAEMRIQIVQMMGANKAHHFGGSFSSVDLVTAIYFYEMKYDPSNPRWSERDRFLMSKGHSVPAQYAALAMLGVFPIEELQTLKKIGSRLQGHPAMQYTPGVEGCTGSLGQGLSYANGIALAARILGKKYHVYCLLGDGEIQEGQIWEAASNSPKLHLTNISAVIDHNELKAMDDSSECCKPIRRIAGRFEALGWLVREIDGHNMNEICEALDWSTNLDEFPGVIVAHTVKGKGVSFMENQPGFHNAPLTQDQYGQAIDELNKHLQACARRE